MAIEALLALLGLGEKFQGKWSSAKKEATGHTKAILRELERNIDLINLWRKSKFDLDTVIQKLEMTRFESAEAAHFNLNEIKSRKLTKTTTKNVPQYAKYIGWSTEKILSNIYRKIFVLKRIVEIDKDNENINKEVRLTNIYKLILLFVLHVDS